MIRRAARSSRAQRRLLWPTPSILLAGAALFIVIGGSAVAATHMITAGDIAPGAVTSRAIKNGAVGPQDLSVNTRALLGGGQGATGAQGDTGAAGSAGSKGETGSTGSAGSNGANGANGPNGANGAEGAKGSNGANGANGPNGANGVNGTDGAKGTNGTDGTNGTNGTDGTNGTVAPLSAKQGLTALRRGSPGPDAPDEAVRADWERRIYRRLADPAGADGTLALPAPTGLRAEPRVGHAQLSWDRCRARPVT